MEILKIIIAACICLVFSAAGWSTKVEELNLLTYNVGLAHGYVPYAEERLPLLTQELKKSDADVICFQEVWKDEDRNVIINNLKSKFPYSIAAPSNQQYRKTGWFKGPMCKITDFFGKGKFFSCILETCGGKSGEEKTQCINNDCRPALELLSHNNPHCVESLMASVGQNEYLVLLKLITPLLKVPRFLFGGAAGTLLMSKYPLKKTGYIDMTDQATLTNRGALYARIELNKKEHFIGCTHLAANLITKAPYPADPPYVKKDILFKNGWENENYYQMNKILEELNIMAGNNPQYLMGDFNCSIAKPKHGILSSFERACNMVLNRGYRDLYAEQKTQCTFCVKTNTLLKSSKEKRLILDHIYLKNVGELTHATTEIKYTQTHPITVKGRTFEAHLSDHYGVQITVPLKRGAGE